MLKQLAFLLLLFIFTCTVKAQPYQKGPQVLTFYSNMDDTEQPYGLYLPNHYDPAKKYPLVIMLHGAGSNHRLALRRVFGKSNVGGQNDVEASGVFPPWNDVDFIVASPFARGTTGYQGIGEKDVYDVLNDVKKRFSIDTDRVYLTGLSMGGGGTLWLGLTRPDLWAAIAPVCPAPPTGTDKFAANGTNYPIHFFQGGADPVVNPADTRNFVDKLKQNGATVTYTEYPGVQHNSWEKAYESEYIFKWFTPFKRNNFPPEVKFVTDHYKYNKSYWVTFDHLTPGTFAKIDASFESSNNINITTVSLEAFSLYIDKHPLYNKNLPLKIKIDGTILKINQNNSLSFSKTNNQWQQQKFYADSNSKRKSLEGPIFDAFSNRHVYVYGTKDNPAPDQLEARMKTAYDAANWSIYRGPFLGRVMFFPRILADKDVRPADWQSSNLILFGTSETNSIIAEESNALPLNMNTDSLSNYGLLYVYPRRGHYVVISSGLPWWTGFEDKGFPFLPAAVRGLTEFKDYILFKGNIRNILVDGYFDDHWKMNNDSKTFLIKSNLIKANK